ncbi:MAG TPA: 50S ribosomal protein L4 [Candidatus Omnitrophota bacterium]|nr:50S ribosomal protein L4 [Candidatus Omnitrophota bacterium]
MEKINNRLPVYDLEGKVVGNILLDKDLFDGTVNTTLLYEAKKMYENNRRRGTASTKTRGDVSGGGIKPWRQKGTGRARVGSTRNPLWRHGGVVFGPTPRDFGYAMPKKAARKALLSGLNARLLEQMIKAVVKIEMAEPKAKVSRGILDKLNVDGKALVIVDVMSDNVKLSFRNLDGVRLMEGRNLNARDVLLHDHIVIEKEAFEKLIERLR